MQEAMRQTASGNGAAGVLVIGGAGSGKSAYAESLCLEAMDANAPLSGALGEARAAGAPDASVHALYLATMPRDGAEAARRIERHRKLRAGKGFATIECPHALAAATPAALKQAAGRVVLLECLGTLAANELFDAEAFGAGEPAGAESAAPSAGFDPPSAASPANKGTLAAALDAAGGECRDELARACAHLSELDGAAAAGALARTVAGAFAWMAAAREAVVVTNDVFSDACPYDAATQSYRRVLALTNRIIAARCARVVEVVCGIPVPVKGGRA